MQISFSPIRSEATLSLSAEGDVLILNGQRFDFGPLQDGDTLPAAAIASGAIAGPVTRVGGILSVTLALPHSEDAPEEVRFPADVTLTAGPCDAPGLVAFDGPLTDGLIDWDQILTADTALAAARAEWRATRRMSKLDLMINLVGAGVISEASAMSPGIPAEFAPMIDALPNPPRNELRIRWAHLVDVGRMHPLILAVQAKLGWPDEQVDALFGWSA